MKTRTKIYLRNKKGIKKGLLIWKVPHHVPQEEMERFRKHFQAALNDPNRPVVCLNLPPDAEWQFITLK